MIAALASIMRNGEGYLDRYLGQAEALRAVLAERGDALVLRVAEGDSTDCTWARLTEAVRDTPGMAIYKLDHGGPEYGSVDHPTRWGNIARTWNGLFERIKGHDFDALIYVEADLLWKPQTMVRLLERLNEASRPVDVVSPMSMHAGGFFYDTWGHRAQGRNFTAWPPYHAGLVDLKPGELLRIDSAGSCMVMIDEVARTCRFSEQDAMLGHSINARGYGFWLDPEQVVVHP